MESVMERENFCHIKVFIPSFNEYPLEKVREWMANYKKQLCHISGQRRKSVHTHKQFTEKIANPLIEASKQCFNKEFKSSHGLNYKEIITNMESALKDKKSAEKYLNRLDATYRKTGPEAERFQKRITLGAMAYAGKMTFGSWRISGPFGAGKKSAASVILGWLTGDKEVVKTLRKEDELLAGIPIPAIAENKLRRFKTDFYNKLNRSFAFIAKRNYASDEIAKQNGRLNRLINTFINDGIIPFEPGGKSHAGFAILPETAESLYSQRICEIQNKIYGYFSDKVFTPVESIPLPKGKSAGDFIGGKEFFVTLDMRFDIKISLK